LSNNSAIVSHRNAIETERMSTVYKLSATISLALGFEVNPIFRCRRHFVRLYT